ncbi:RNA-binding transcriptional accessory protein [Candidatus Izimaplasma bacterium]|nr:RNA-binding transcriptional accessory protein [Candidatus Izimaplasma bacterium]
MEINAKLVNEIAGKLQITKKQIETVLLLLDEGNTVPFIARYRKEQTGTLDEEQIRDINKEYEYKVNLLKRKEDVIRLIDEKGMLTEEIEANILKAEKLVDIEDIYRPFKEKKKTKATMAIKQGLKPLAEFISEYPTEGNLEDEAKKYITEEVESVEKAIEGALFIIAEDISDSPEYRKWIRNFSFRNGILQSKMKKNAKDDMDIFEMYYAFEEQIKKVKLYRALAINRGEKEKILGVKINVENEQIHEYLEKQIVKNKASFVLPYIQTAVKDAYKRLIMPSIERELRSELTEKADNNAIHIFSENLRSLLLQPPLKGKMILGVDPAYRTGCKLAVIDTMGTMAEIDVIYPHQKFPGEKVSPERRNTAGRKVAAAIKKYDIDIVAIGNGTASRETEQFIINVIKFVEKDMDKKVYYVIVNEAGASVYSASELARKEFPDLAVEERSAVSIARRLQDPLSELVKIDPKSIGVGQYQHDVSQKNLSDSLDFVVETAVNKVGVNVNTASVQLLQYVAGLNKTQATNIVTYREKNGAFKNREEIKKVPRLGDKAYEQAIGFLRVLNSPNPFDKTGIHPESYDLALRLMKELKLDGDDIGNPIIKLKLMNTKLSTIANKLDAGLNTVEDIFDAFVAPLRDPRDDAPLPVLRSDILKLDDLTPGMELRGTVRNVVDFGAFVDCGVKDDGLVHISQLTKGFVKHPLDVVSVGEVVTVWVKDIDLKRHRLQLTMIKENAPFSQT